MARGRLQNHRSLTDVAILVNMYDNYTYVQLFGHKVIQ
ncbi:protein of unknown function [Kyrpidia spormannii]|uniref:Uncharacterized protein n=2 Tax=Kyrpidia spormannii TaxID=2055160 RepID=A0ACA8Z8L7_9BACL|nr:protein of unknown function [Kyrpidia spormannii]CAB3392964.1 protein of unknown function [Kyrpidia spormannii]